MHYALLHLFGKHCRDANDLPLCEIYGFDSHHELTDWVQDGPAEAGSPGYREPATEHHPTVRALLSEETMFPGDLSWLDGSSA